MHGYWSFEITRASTPRQRTLVAFCSAPNPDVEEVSERLAGYCDTNFSPDRLYLIAPECERAAIQTVFSSGKFQDRIRDATQHRKPPKAECLFFDARGTLLDGGRTTPAGDVVRMIKRRGLTQLVREKHVFRSAPSSHHFAVPSGGHSQVFFRAGDAMTDGAAIDFMAFCCLEYLPQELRHIYCDSGTVSPVAYSINALRMRVDPGIPVATVSSFESYSGFKTFHFRDIERAVILVSLTTTGALAPAICRTHTLIPRDAVVHLFSLCDIPTFRHVVCDLRRDTRENPDGFEDVETHPADKCPLCARRSSLIRISSDQFLPGDVEVRPLRLSTGHKPDWLNSFLERVVGKGFIRANYRSEAAKHATSEVFFDLEELFKDPKMLGVRYYADRVDWLVNIAVPAMLTRIVHIDGAASAAMSDAIRRRVESRVPGVTVHNYADIVGELERHVRAEGATLVVAAAAASGRSLLSVSQKLRDIQPNGAIVYLVGLARFRDAESANELMINLTFGEQARRYGYHVLDRVFLPLVGSLETTSWEAEKELLTALQTSCDDVTAGKLLEKRMDALRNAASRVVRGMSTDLFWPARNETPLKLRATFAFFDFPQPPELNASQADVFFTMAAVLHDLRQRRDPDSSLHQHEHVHRVLSPRNFDRFNDGVIQSCLLRAAAPPELDYSGSEHLSIEMMHVLEVILSNDTTPTGEASREFLLALALKRLQLRPVEVQALKTRYGDGRGDPIAKLLWTQIGTGIRPGAFAHPCG